MIIIGDFEYVDEEQVIESFRDLLKPKYNSGGFGDYSRMDSIEFSAIMEWLNENNFVIREFPNAIQRKMSLKSFGSDTIRSYIQSKNPGLSKVAWSDRRALIDTLTIERKYVDSSFAVEDGIDDIMKEIAMGTGSFDNQSKENKLANLNNCVEYLLKDKKKFRKVESYIFYDFLNESDVIKFRKETHVFRHHDREAIVSRNGWSERKKDFYIRMGIIIVTEVYFNTESDENIF